MTALLVYSISQMSHFYFLSRNNPVSIEVVLEFMGVLSIPEMQELIAAIIFEDTPRYRYNNVVGHLIGDLLVYYADLMIYTDSTVFGEYCIYPIQTP